MRDGRLRRYAGVDVGGHRFDALDETPDRLRQFGVLLEQLFYASGERRVLLHHLDEQRGLRFHLRLTLVADAVQFLAVLRVGDAVRLVAVRLSRLASRISGAA